MKVAIVTGAYKGQGFEWCRQLGQLGYKVILTARDFDKAEKAAKTLREEGCDVIAKSLAIQNENELNDLSEWVSSEYGKVDLIVNNAAINPKDYLDKARMAKTFFLDSFDVDEVLEVLRINAMAPILILKHFRSLLKKSEKSIVINISSWLGSVSLLSFGGHYGYAGSKNLLNLFTKSASIELQNDNIIAISINPGWVKTDMGGEKANLSSQESIRSMILNVLEKVSLEDSGKFFNYDGNIHPW
jgi:NAD(P)-dependent dehydrogenase (short-subunit alcohol dehydrogenase family)